MRASWIASACLGLAVMAHASINTPAEPVKDHQEQISSAEQSIDQGVAYLRDNNSDAAAAAFSVAIHSPVFAQLPPNARKRAFLLSGLIAFEKKDYATALDQLKQCTSISTSDLNDRVDEAAWSGRLESAYYLGNDRDAALSVIYVAPRWPAAITAMDPGVIYQIEAGIRGTNGDLERYYLQALFDMNWNSTLGTADDLWRDLSWFWLKEGNTEKAILVSRRVTAAHTVISMLVDKRFDPITQVLHFDVDQVIAKELAADKAAVSAAPDTLKPVTALQDFLLDTHRYAEALSLSDAVIAKAGDGSGAKAYKDFDEFYVWVLDGRARALERLGRWDDAIRQWQHAARRPEQGAMNVSQVINLASLYAGLQRPKEALDMLSDVGNMSPYGRMQLEKIKLKAAIEQNDEPGIAQHLDYLRAHRADDIASWEIALIVTNHLDAAADLLVERLSTDKWRSDALVDMQDYLDTTQTPLGAEEMRRWKIIVARPTVQRELAKVGRVEHFNLDSP